MTKSNPKTAAKKTPVTKLTTPKAATKKPAAAKSAKSKKPAKTLSLVEIIISALEDLKAQDIVTLDVSGMTEVTDTLVIASGTSNRQVRALASNVMESLNKEGIKPIGHEGLDGGEWALVDFVDAVVHVMLPETRAFYDLERLWKNTAARPPAVTPAMTDYAGSTKKPTSRRKPATAEKTTSSSSTEKTTRTKTTSLTKTTSRAKPGAVKSPAAKRAPTKTSATSTVKPARKTAIAKPALTKTTATKLAAKSPSSTRNKVTTTKSSTSAKTAAKKPRTK
jgi:ribosome-associated protein